MNETVHIEKLQRREFMKQAVNVEDIVGMKEIIAHADTFDEVHSLARIANNEVIDLHVASITL